MAGSINPSPIPYNLDDEDPLKSSESLPVLKKTTQPPRLRKGLAPPKVEAKRLKGGVKCQLKPPATKSEVGRTKNGPIKSQVRLYICIEIIVSYHCRELFQLMIIMMLNLRRR